MTLLTRSTTLTLLATTAALGAALGASPALAQAAPKTAAGTTINNTATASYDDPTGAGRATVPSNTVSVRVDELIDVFVDNTDPGAIATRNGAVKQVTSFVVTNTGNGPESFRLSATGALTGDDFDPTDVLIYLDAPGGVTGQYDPGDTLYTPGGNDPLLAQDGSVVAFVLANIPAAARNGQFGLVSLTATAATGTGAPGTVVAGAGAGGGDAVIGTSGGRQSDTGRYDVAAATVALTKTQTVLDPFGGSRAVPGSTITYTLAAAVTGSGSLTGLRVTDDVPAGATYQAGSVTLNGAAKTDAVDADEAQVTNRSVTVSLGTVPAGETRTVTFQVKVD